MKAAVAAVQQSRPFHLVLPRLTELWEQLVEAGSSHNSVRVCSRQPFLSEKSVLHGTNWFSRKIMLASLEPGLC